MTKAGLILTTEQPFAEALLNVAPNTNIASNGNATIVIGTFTMPCAGTAIAHYKVHSSWSVANIQQVTCVPTPSTPAPSVAYGSVKTENGLAGGGGAMWIVSPVLVQWNGLAAGAIITVRVNVAVSTFAPTVNVSGASAMMRAYRT